MTCKQLLLLRTFFYSRIVLTEKYSPASLCMDVNFFFLTRAINFWICFGLIITYFLLVMRGKKFASVRATVSNSCPTSYRLLSIMIYYRVLRISSKFFTVSGFFSVRTNARCKGVILSRSNYLLINVSFDTILVTFVSIIIGIFSKFFINFLFDSLVFRPKFELSLQIMF